MRKETNVSGHTYRGGGGGWFHREVVCGIILKELTAIQLRRKMCVEHDSAVFFLVFFSLFFFSTNKVSYDTMNELS